MNGVMFRKIQVWRHELRLEQACTACCVMRATAVIFGLHVSSMKFNYEILSFQQMHNLLKRKRETFKQKLQHFTF
jgi:hypothetical protein